MLRGSRLAATAMRPAGAGGGGGTPPPPEGEWVIPYAPGDGRQGVSYFLGTAKGVSTFTNPHPSTLLASQSSQNGASAAQYALDRTDDCSHTNQDTNAWWQMDLTTAYKMVPTGVSICQRIDSVHAFVGMEFLGSNNGTDWTVLGTVTANVGGWTDLALTGDVPYRYLRARMTTVGNYGAWYLVIREIDFYGTLIAQP